MADFIWQVDNSPAGLLIVLLDRVQTSDVSLLGTAQDLRLDLMRYLVGVSNDSTGGKWGVCPFDDDAGAFLFKRTRITADVKQQVIKVEDHIYMSADVQLEKGYNPRAAVAAAVCFRLNQTTSRYAPWPRHFLGTVSAAVRRLGGYYRKPICAPLLNRFYLLTSINVCIPAINVDWRV